MSIGQDINTSIRDITCYTKAYLPLFKEELVTADSDSIRAAMTSNDKVRVFRKRNWLFRSLFIGFEPLVSPIKKGFILYPGAFVESKAYAPIARTMADRGFYAAVATPPLDLSLTDVNLANDVKEHWQSEANTWAISGHSLGGVVAAAYANDHFKAEDKLKGLVMLASFPSDRAGFLEGDVSTDPFTVTSIYGTDDGLTTLEEIEKAKPLLPKYTKYIAIEGGNHTQFYYSTKLQKGDNPPKISRGQQQDIIRENILELLNSI